MAIYLKDNVKLMPQDKTNGCWYFCAKMMANWSAKAGNKTIKDPAEVRHLYNLYDSNSGYALSVCKTLANDVCMKALPRVQRGYDEYLKILKSSPIWAAGAKGAIDGAFHVIVIIGVADTGVLVLDPLPVNVGKREWRTWAWLDSFIALDNGNFDANLLVEDASLVLA